MTYLEIAARGKNAAWRYALGLTLGVVVAMVAGAVLLAPLFMAHLVSPNIAQQAQNPENASSYVFIGFNFALLLAGFAVAVRIANGKRFSDIVGIWRWTNFARGFGLWAAMLTAMTLIDLAIAPSGFKLTANAQTPMLAAAAIPALGVQTFAEEFLFRGYITQGLLLATKRPIPAAILSGLVFGAVHIPNGAPQAANAVVFGVVLALIAIRTGGLAFGFGLHMINNLFGSLIVVSGGDIFHGSPGLFAQTTPHLMWWDVVVGCMALFGVAALVLKGPLKVGDQAAREGTAA